MSAQAMGSPTCSAAVFDGGLPLYLVSGQAVLIRARDSSLVLTSRTASSACYPISHITRIVSSTSNSWEGAALALCMRSRVPIIFFERGVGPAGWLFPREHAPAFLEQMIDEFVTLPHWKRIYSDWLRAERNRVILAWARVRERAGSPAPEHQIADWRRKYVYRGDNQPAPVLPEIWNVALLALVMRTFALAGLAPSFTTCDSEVLNIAEDCASLISLMLFPAAEGIVGASTDLQVLLRGFEVRSSELRQTLLRALCRLRRLIHQDLYSCH